MDYDLFISYSRKDNLTNRITELKAKIEADYLAFANEELKCFFDKNEIKGMEDWRHRILEGLKYSHMFLLILTPNYLQSQYCEWEIVEYLKYENARATQGDSIAQIYFVEITGFETPGFIETGKSWLEKISRRERIDLRPWYEDGENSLKDMNVRNHLEELKRSLHHRINRMRRIEKVPGNLPAPNARFVGREREMKLMHESVGLGKFGVMTAIHGVGGLGKTSIAFQYAYAYADFYPGGRWHIGCANETNLAAVLKKLDLDLKVTFTMDEKKDDIRGAKRIINELEILAIKGAEARSGEINPPKPMTLLLLDNVDHPDLIQQPNTDLFTGKDWLKILVTTRFGPVEFGSDETKYALISIDELPLDDALSLIESYQPGGCFRNIEEKEKAKEIVKMLGCFTLAVEVAALYLYERRGQISCADFLELLRREGSISALDIAGSKTKTSLIHTKLITSTLAPTLDILPDSEKLILNYASLLPPDSVPIPWLRALVSKDYPEFATDAEIGLDDPWLSAINHLISLRLLQIAELEDNNFIPRIVRIHRLIQQFLDNRIKEGRDTLLSRLIQFVCLRTDYLHKNWVDKETRWEISPVIACCSSWILKNIADSSYIANQIQWALTNLGYYSDAKDLLVKAIVMEEKIHELTDATLSNYYFNLAAVEYDLGDQQVAKESLIKAIELIVNKYGPDDPSLSPYYSNLSLVEQALGNPEESKRLLKNVIEIDEKFFRLNKPHLALDYSNLATIEHDLGNYTDAKELILKAISIGEDIYDPNHPQLALYYAIYAMLEQALGNFTAAEPYMRKAFEIRKGVYGPNHPERANGMVSLGRLLVDLGQIEEADRLAQEAIEVWKKSDNPNDWRLGKAFWILGLLEARSANFMGAKNHFEKALSFLRLGRAENHPWVCSVKQELERCSKKSDQ